MLPGWSQNEIVVNGASIHYYRTGDGRAGPVPGMPALVLAHGFSDNGLCWQQVACELEDEYDVLMPDAPGHGRSARLEGRGTLDMPLDLAEVIRSLGLDGPGLDRPIVGGHSMGAAVAAQLAARFPKLVRALILEDPPWFLPRPAEARPEATPEDNPMKKWVESLAEQTLEQVIEQCRIDHPSWPEIVIQMWCLGKKQLDLQFFSTLQRAVDNWQETARSITCPVLLVTADPELGGLITPEVAGMIKELNPNFHQAHIPGVGHHVRFGNHALYMDAVRAFLRGL